MTIIQFAAGATITVIGLLMIGTASTEADKKLENTVTAWGLVFCVAGAGILLS